MKAAILSVSTLLLLAAAAPLAHSQLTIRVSIKRVMGPGGVAPGTFPGVPGGGGQTTGYWTAANAQAAFNQAQTIFANNNLNLALVENKAMPDPHVPSSWFVPNLDAAALTGISAVKTMMEQAAETDPDTYLWNPNAVNIYLVDHIRVNGQLSTLIGHSSFPGQADQNDLILLAPQNSGNNPITATNSNGWVMAHEIAHYLNVFHTDQTPTTPLPLPGACGPSPLCGLSDDQCCDTRPDPTNSFTLASTYPTGLTINPNPGQVLLGCDEAYWNLRLNVMSAYDPIPDSDARFTPEQEARMVAELTGPGGTRSKVVLPTTTLPTINSVTFGSPNPAYVEILINGSGLPFGSSVDAALGQAICSFIAPPTPNCHSAYALSGGPQPGSSASTVIVRFPPGSVTTGRHNVGLYDGGELVASMINALEVRPWIDLTTNTTMGPGTWNSVLHIRSRINASTNFLVGIGSEIPATPLPIGTLFIAPGPTLHPVSTDQFGNFLIGVDLYAALPPSVAGIFTAIQGVEFDPVSGGTNDLLTNFVRFHGP